ncbi:hypothetical protein AK812_SmicGene4618 [Symbiodinium microadriaticum]|uniref:Retrovirus-related Pol polyprotein from transposon TNT 1-94 n=1 Tax=Symbiodinium microadriaticum TaxID=2951 RepID=A0A1Q9EW34_SYMMI|nr:hypothetical protein AK812_SmicGene4618 [Symbiodinium microadriaticum]
MRPRPQLGGVSEEILGLGGLLDLYLKSTGTQNLATTAARGSIKRQVPDDPGPIGSRWGKHLEIEMSGTAEQTTAAVGRTKDGIPTWGGEAGTFVQYEEAALLWEQSLTWEKRYTAGPKLVQELSGAAKRLVAGQPAGWVAYRGGVSTLMGHLRQALGKPKVNEVTDLLASYFKGTRRRPQESMNDYITRKTEAYMRASQALKRVQPHYEKERYPPYVPDPGSRRGSGDQSSWGWSRQWTPATQEDSGHRDGDRDDDGQDGGATETSTRATTTQEDNDSWGRWHPNRWNTWNGWSWGHQWGGHWGYHDWSSHSSTTSTTSTSSSVELLPQFIQGWYLLADANLDAGERNVVMTALNGSFDPQRVAQELRNQFSEADVKKRDSQKRYSYLGEFYEDLDEDHDHLDNGSVDLHIDDLTEEENALVVDAEHAAQEAMATMFNARRTLREARQKQHAVKQNRKYFQGSASTGSRGPSSSSSSAPKPRDDSGIECLRCGQRGHRVANCPHKPLSETKGQANMTGDNSKENHQAPFVCYSETHAGFATDHFDNTALATISQNEALTTAEAVREGMAVIDGGATQTIGSVAAVEAVMRKNKAKYGCSGLRGVDYQDPPVFSFGNSTENRCLSTARLGITANGQKGEMRIHTLEDGESPILMSIESLRSVGALIDFEADLAVFRNLDPGRIVRLARGKSGHQLLPLSEDLLGASMQTQQPVPSLAHYLPDQPRRRHYCLPMKDFLVMIAATFKAQDVVPLTFAFVPRSMDKMTCPQMVLSLRAYGEEPPKEWKKVQLLQRLKELEEQGEIVAPASKSKTPLAQAVSNLNRAGSKKALLQKFVMDECGIKVTGNETMHILTQRAMSHLLATVEAVGEEPLGFGKYASQSYETVAQNDPQYCNWAITTAEEGPCSEYLKRFATWLVKEKEEKKKRAPETRAKLDLNQVMTKKKQGGYTIVGDSEVKVKKEKETPTATSTTPSMASSSQATIEQLALAVQSLANEVKTLKEEKGEKPRKILATADQEMENQKEKQRLQDWGFQCPDDVNKEAYAVETSPPALKARRNLAALDPLPPKLYTIEADIGNWVHPHTEESVNFMIIVDTGSRFRAARILSQGSKRTPCAQDCLHYLEEGWVQYFGHPRSLRLDPAGAFRSSAVEEWCDKHSIFLDIVPGEAHWKIGAVESAVKGAKELMTKLCHYDQDLTPQQALAEAITTFNHKELVRGYSPAQHVLGQAPDETGRFILSGNLLHPDLLVENPTEEFERGVRLRAEAEKALSDWMAHQRLMRAKHSRHRPCYDYTPGELVYYWRTQDSNKGRRQPGKHGRFLGPARILATETRLAEDGQARPGGAVWLVKGRSLLKCAPEQLRRATDREELLESLADPAHQRMSWTYHIVANEIGGNRYEDISGDLPSTAEWHRAQRPDEEAQPVRYRLRSKRGAEDLQGVEAMEEDVNAEAKDSQSEPRSRVRSRSRARGSTEGPPSPDRPTAWWNDVQESQWPEQQASFWNDRNAAVEIAISFPESQRGCAKALKDLGAYMVGSMKRRAVELSERRMTPEERTAFDGAKAIEVKNFIASKAFEILPDHAKPDKSQAIGMRWILTWKLKEVSRSTVETIVKANCLLHAAKQKHSYKMKIHAFKETDDLTMVMWVDAANANRIDGGSTQGLFMGITSKEILRGAVCPVSPMAWHSQKIERTCRSPGAAEAQAAVNGEDCLYYGRYEWSELLHGGGDLHEPDQLVRQTGGCVVTDSRNVYDRLETEVMVIKGAEKRTSLELLAIKESQANTGVGMRWVHSEAQLANSLTKAGGFREYELYYKMGHQWRLVEDASMMSAKRRKEMGLQPLEQHKDRSKVSEGVQRPMFSQSDSVPVKPEELPFSEDFQISQGGISRQPQLVEASKGPPGKLLEVSELAHDILDRS